MKKRELFIGILGAVALGVILSFLLYPLKGHYRQGEGGKIPSRVVCMAPNITEIVFALGEGKRVVGVTDFCAYPPAAGKKTRVGGYINPNFERLIVLAPDLVIIQGRHEKLANFCRGGNIPFINMEMNDIESILGGIEKLGKILGCPEKSASLMEKIEKELAAIKNRVADLPCPRVFLCLGRNPGSLAGLFTTGKNGFLSELLVIAGGENIFSDVLTSYPQASMEALIRRAPEVIIETCPGKDLPKSKKALLLKDWQSLPTLPAVKKHQIYLLTDDFLQVPGPRIYLAAKKIASVLHPECFHGN